MATENGIVLTEERQLARAPEAATFITILDRAINSPEFDVNKLQALLEAKERYEAAEAKKAYNVAMNTFKANAPEITKNKHVQHNDFWHATLDNIVGAVAPALSAVGITHRWKTATTEKGLIRVTCILTHALGHSEETTLEAAPDPSGSKNSIQAVASTVTYLERYTLMAATGLAAKGQDDDGRAAEQSQGMDTQGVEDWCAAIRGAVSLQEMQDQFNQAVRAAKLAKDDAAITAFTKVKDARKVQLQPRR